MRSNLREESIWCEDSVRESWNRPRSSVQVKCSVDPALRELERAIFSGIQELLIRVVPPKSFGPFTGIRGLFLYTEASDLI